MKILSTVICSGLALSSSLAFSANHVVKPMNFDGPLKEPVSICEANSVFCAFRSPGGFYASGTALYVRPSETGLGMFTDSWQYSVSGGTLSQSKPFDVSHDWAGAGTIGYDFADSANSIEGTYFGLRSSTNAYNTSGDNGGATSFGSVFFPDVTLPNPPFFVISDANLKYKLDQADLKVARLYTEGSGRFTFRPKAGVRFLKLEHRLVFKAPGNVISSYKGAGLLFGLDSRYSVYNHFGLVANVEYAYIAGLLTSHSYLNLAAYETYNSPKRDRIVSNFVGKLGVDYRCVFGNGMLTTLEAGYQINQYTNAMDTIRGNVLPGGTKIVDISTNSFGFRGPYLTLAVHA